MNRTIFTLLLDYARRTFGVWALVVFVQLMQTSTVGVLRSAHLPIIGAVIAALAFNATWDSPHLVMRMLPIRACELALLRWWERIGMPMLFIGLGLLIAWLASERSPFPRPVLATLSIYLAASFATLGVLSVLPLPVLSAARSNMPVFVVVWIALLIGGLYGVPMEWLPAPLPELLLAGGTLLAFVSLGLARSGRVLQIPPPSGVFARLRQREAPPARMRLRGWPVLAMQWLRMTLLLTLTSVVLISIVRPHVRILQSSLPWIFVSLTGAIGTILGHRLLRSLRAMLCLPISSSMLAFVVCVAWVSPVIVASVAASAVNAIVPEWGIAVPLYMLPVIALMPAFQLSWQTAPSNHPVPASIEQWSPLVQLVMWPMWTGAFMSLQVVRFMPRWFELVVVAIAVALAGTAYAIVLSRIRAGVGLERYGEPLTPR